MARTRRFGSYDTIDRSREEHALCYLHEVLLSPLDIPVEVSVILADMCTRALGRMASGDALCTLRRFSSADNVQDPLAFLKAEIASMYATRVRRRDDRTQTSINDYFLPSSSSSSPP